MSDDPKITRIYPNRTVPKSTRQELEREIEILKTAVLSLTEEVRDLDRTLGKLIRVLGAKK